MLPEAADDDLTTVVSQISAPVCLKVEPVGRWYQAYINRRHHRRTLSHTDDYNSSSSSDYSDDDITAEDEDLTFLSTLDPKEWKNQDHYRVLGLGHLRFRATDQQIKKAYKMKVLKHHPDKRKNKTHEPRKEGDDDYFTCITKANDIIGHPQKRRAYDSVDPEFDDSVPSVNQDSKDNFFEEFTEVFERNARWSITKRIAKFGNMKSSKSDVNRFYGFWYDFDSWREYSYLDEEEKDKGQDRDERRWIEKQNKIARQKRKKEEMARIRELVDNAYACDPRIKKFKDDEKKRKEDEKKARQDATRHAAEEREREKQAALESERLAKEKEEEEARIKALALKKERDILKKALKKEKKFLRDTCKKYNYFTTNEVEALKQMQELEKLCETLNLLSLQELNQALKSESEEEAKQAYLAQVQYMNEEIEKEKREMLQSKKTTGSKGSASSTRWDDSDVQLLIKGVNLFPAGTGTRWEVIAGFMNQHSTSGVKRNAKDVITKAKSMQKLDPSQKDAANRKAFDKFEQSKGVKGAAAADAAEPSQRFGANGKEDGGDSVDDTPKQWTGDEQKLLEQALKTYPASTKERWDKISAAVPTRTKKECMKRYKDLVEMVKAKKAVQAQTSRAKKT